jgi:hypothetical protein
MIAMLKNLDKNAIAKFNKLMEELNEKNDLLEKQEDPQFRSGPPIFESTKLCEQDRWWRVLLLNLAVPGCLQCLHLAKYRIR